MRNSYNTNTLHTHHRHTHTYIQIYTYLFLHICEYVLCLVAQSCLTLCNPTDCSPPGSSAHGDSPGRNTGVGCHALLQGIFPTWGSNPGLLYCRQILTVWASREAHMWIFLSLRVCVYIYVCTFYFFNWVLKRNMKHDFWLFVYSSTEIYGLKYLKINYKIDQFLS